MIDDVFPIDEHSAHPVEGISDKLKKEHGITHRAWFGDAWKVIPIISRFHSDWEVVVLGGSDGTHGQALVCRGVGVAQIAEVSAPAIEAIRKMEFDDYFGGRKDVFATLTVSADSFLQPKNLREWLRAK